ncbi:amidohydrolase family protein [Christiangramia aquimixticola]|uniref:amidohydrolase family protein n=1 Tax=Christiangramia aquimixticola TaxID=1697558 RepID=UPI003AA8CAF8
MKKVLLSALMLCLFVSFPAASQSDHLYIKAGKFYDSESNKILKDQVIEITNNKISAVGPNLDISENAQVIDLSNHTVLPGLIDAHTHVLFSQTPQDDFSVKSIQTLTMESPALRTLRGANRVQSYLDEGFTSIKDLGNSGQYLDVALRDAINEGTTIGPRIFASGPILCSIGGQIYGVSHTHQDLIDLEYRIIKNEDDAINAVREHVNQNVDIIKICADNLPNNTRLSLKEMKAIVETAHSYGLKVTAHCVLDSSARTAIEAGVDGLEHGFFLSDETMNLMAKNNIYLVPTENSQTYMDKYYELEGSKQEDLDWMEGYMKKTRERLMKAKAKGVVIIAGSDNYNDLGVSQGKISKDMFRAYYEAGMKPLDILQSATYLSANAMGKEDKIGIIKPGAFADLIAVKGDLNQDFLNTLENIVLIMKDGKIYKNEIE